MDIQPIGQEKRNLKGMDYLLLWAGVAISMAEIWAGGFLTGMGFWMGVWAIILGHVIGNTLMGLGGIMGSDHGITAMVSVRPSFGIRGSNLAALLNIIQLIGWASIMLIIGGKAGAMLGEPVGGIFASSHFWIVLIGMGTLFWAMYTGRGFWKLMQSIAVVALLIICLLMSYVSLTRLGDTQAFAPPEKMSFMTGLDLVIAMPISWLPLVADYSRYSKNTSSAFWNTWWGYFIVSSWMYVLGLAAAGATGNTDPAVLILEVMGKIGLAVPALIMVVFSTVTSDFPDIYSATCSMLNISPKFSPKAAMWGAGILSILVALVFPAGQYENFLLFIGAMFIPLFGVVLTDYFILRKRRLNLTDLFATKGEYWYFKGFNPAALIAWALGFGLFQVISIYRLSVGGSIPSMILAGVVYWVLSRRK